MEHHFDIMATVYNNEYGELEEDTVSTTPSAIASAVNDMRSFDQEEFFRDLFYALDVSAREELRRAIR